MRFPKYAFAVLILFLLTSDITSAQQPASAAKPYLVIMDFQIGAGLPSTLGPAISDRVREVLMGTKIYTIIDRGNQEAILREIAQGQTGCYDEACILQAGRLLSVHFIITGRVVKLGTDTCQLSAQIRDVARAEIVRTASYRCPCNGEAFSWAAENVALDLTGIDRKPGTLIVNTNPAGAEVVVDGQSIGISPITTKIQPGKHLLVVVLQGYKLVEQGIVVSPGADLTKEITLEKLLHGVKKKPDVIWGIALIPMRFFQTSSGVGRQTGLRAQHRATKGLWVYADAYFFWAAGIPENANYSLPNGQILYTGEGFSGSGANPEIRQSSGGLMCGGGAIYVLPYFKRTAISFEGGFDYLSTKYTLTNGRLSNNFTTALDNTLPVYGHLDFGDNPDRTFSENLFGFDVATNFTWFSSKHMALTLTAGYMILPSFTVSNEISAMSSTMGPITLRFEKSLNLSAGLFGDLRISYLW